MTSKIFPETKFEEDAYLTLKDATDRIKLLRYKLGLPKRFRIDYRVTYSHILRVARKRPFKSKDPALKQILKALRDEAYAQGKIKAILFYRTEAKSGQNV